MAGDIKEGDRTMTLNAHVLDIKTRSPFLMWLLRLSVKLCGAEMRVWRSRPRRERESDANDPGAN